MSDELNPELDLVLERVVPAPVEKVWRAWTTEEHFQRWFVPAPWSCADCSLDVRPGGQLRTVMRSPEGEDSEMIGCFLEVVPQRRLVFTDALLPGYRPGPSPFFTAIITMEPAGEGTRYVARAIHGDPEARAKHEEMGFHHGWGAALDQLVALARELE